MALQIDQPIIAQKGLSVSFADGEKIQFDLSTGAAQIPFAGYYDKASFEANEPNIFGFTAFIPPNTLSEKGMEALGVVLAEVKAYIVTQPPYVLPPDPEPAVEPSSNP